MIKRTLVIGDVHGAYKALNQVLEKAAPSKGDHLIFLGDYVDGWPESYRVIDLLISLSQNYSCTFIRGNHDVWCAAWLNGNQADEAWLQNKGMSTIKSYDEVSPSEKTLHSGFFSSLENFYVDQSNRLFVHAGFTAMKGPAQEPYPYHLYNDRTLLETALATNAILEPESVFYPKRLKLFDEIFIGHTPTTRYNVTTPLKALNLWDLDTGAAQGNRVSAMDIDTKEIWQSEQVQGLYN